MKPSPLFSDIRETSVQRIAHFSMLAACAVLCLGLSTTAAVRMSSMPPAGERPQITFIPALAPTPVAAVATPTPAAAKPTALAAPAPASTELLHPAHANPAARTVTLSSATSHQSLSTTRTIRLQVTAYCPCRICCGRLARGVTASGKHVNYAGGKFVAADTDLLPFGTKLSIPGYHSGRPVEVIDRGGDIKGRHIDVFFPTHKQAKEWGVQYMTVTVTE